jgi:hypothetical protein
MPDCRSSLAENLLDHFPDRMFLFLGNLLAQKGGFVVFVFLEGPFVEFVRLFKLKITKSLPNPIEKKVKISENRTKAYNTVLQCVLQCYSVLKYVEPIMEVFSKFC